MTIGDSGLIPESVRTIRESCARLGHDALTEDGLREHVWALFSRVLTRDSEIYLANHSLGRPLDVLADDLAEFASLWYRDLDGAWEHESGWMAEREAYRARMARLIGCGRADAIVPKTAAGQGLRAVLNGLPASRPRVLATRGEFDSVDFILKTYHDRGRAEVAWIEPGPDGLYRADGPIGAVRSSERPFDLVVVSAVYFSTGQVLEGLDELIRAAHERGTLVLVDHYHSAGVIPVGFDASGADFGIGGNYKYTRGGPGCCWLAVHERHLRGEHDPMPGAGAVRPIDTGWFAKERMFEYSREGVRTAPGGDGWLESTPPIVTYYQARSGLELTLALGVERLRAYSLEQQRTLTGLLASEGVETWDHHPRGAYVLVPVADGFGAARLLKEAGVNVDARPVGGTERECVRLCPDILTSAEELERAAGIVGRVLGGM
ncbi:MAG: aminotransferase class V-fold PLP-dependent enzyme [Phycisphaerales bacterium JB040]